MKTELLDPMWILWTIPLVLAGILAPFAAWAVNRSFSFSRGKRLSQFLNWLLGVLSIATAVYCSRFFPDHWILPQRFVVGFMVALISGWCYMTFVPARIAGYSENVTKGRALYLLVLIVLFQFMHPQWLSGDSLGWVSPFFPVLLGITAIVSVLRIFGS